MKLAWEKSIFPEAPPTISGCEERLHDILHAAAASPVKTNTNSANPGQLKLAGEEDASYVSPERLRRRRGAAG